MLYVIGVEEDEKNHLKHCRNRQHLHIDTLSINSLRHEWATQQGGGRRKKDCLHDHQIQMMWEDVEKCVSIIKVRLSIL
jgi:hypothetical protein